ncbi:MAG: mechanosensitive ion channel family protein [Pseudomonadota bacterium]
MIQILENQIQSMIESAIQSVPALIIATILICLTWAAAKVATRTTDRIVGKTSLRQSLQTLLSTLVKLGIWLTGMMIAAVVVFPGMSAGSLIAGLGVGTVAIGFAFQDIFENFLAGVLIMLREKMRIGDTIEVDGILGKVEHITLRETHIRSFSGELTIVPNSAIFKNSVEIWTDEPSRRFEVSVGVSYDTDLDHAARVMRAAVERCELVDQEQPIQILADGFGSSSVDFLVRWWAPSSGSEAVLNRDEVIRAIKSALDKAEIEIPFPYITHTFKERVPLGEKVGEAA